MKDTTAYLHLKEHDPDMYAILEREIIREDDTLELIASENFVSYPVLEMAGGRAETVGLTVNDALRLEPAEQA